MSLIALAKRELAAAGADEEFSSLITGTMEQFFDRCCGLGGWTEGLLAEGFSVIGSFISEAEPSRPWPE